jgi:DNA polymerase (family 10)
MDNDNISAIFLRIAKLLQIKGESVFKISAYQNAAEIIRNHPQNITALDAGELKAIPGIGQAIAEKIQEMGTTGKLHFLERLEAEIPPSLLAWLELPGVGPKTTALIWKTLGITTLDELYNAAQAGKLHRIQGIGEKLEENICAALKERRDTSGFN